MTTARHKRLPVPSGLASVLFLTLIFLVNFVARLIFSPLLHTIERELRITHSQAGLFFFLISAGYVLGLLGSGLLASRATHRLAITVSTAGIGTAMLAIAAADSLWPMAWGFLALGFAAGLYIPSAIATITSIIAPAHWGKAIAVHELAPNVAFFISPFIAEAFLKWATWRCALVAIGAVALVCGGVYGRLGHGGDFPGESPFSSAFGRLVRLKTFWLMLILFGFGVSSTIGVYAMLPLYLASERGLTPSSANTLVALSRSYGPALGLLGGWVSDRLGPKRTIVIALVFSGVATALLGIVQHRALAFVVLIQPLVAVWFFPAAFAALAAITPPEARNLAVAFTVPAGYIIGAGAIPALIGLMGDAGSFALGYTITGGLILLSGALGLTLKLPASRAPG
ncbi:MAG TPA: MFS transporter [Candidatus Eisenbacteria bacterium]|nr:MFS transporter [Candidatus Eisenbacteria bacterium]